MSDAKTPPEPSIDEILATIRRIISDDEQAGPTAAATVDTTAPKAAEAKPADDDDVLELTEAVNEDGTTRHLAPIGGRSSPRPAAVSEAPAPQVDPLLRLRPSSLPGSGPGPGPEPLRRDAPSLRLTPAPPPASPTSSAQNEPRLPRDVPVGGGARTLEDIVGDTLRPLLQAWLDENLPPIVERLVQAEITRVAREAAGRG